jgi:deoxycytidine triphosphate deaminase
VNTPGLVADGRVDIWVEPQLSVINEGDTICIVGLNFNKDQYEFLKEFDNNTSSNNQFNSVNIYDQLKIPTNLPTNIEPADKAAGYFFVYSVSKISKVFND